MKMASLAAGAILALAPMALADVPVSAGAIGFLCSAEQDAPPTGSVRRLAMVPGVGTGGFAIATKSPQAQAWFNYGMQLAHAFYHADAKAAFHKASELDPGCAMCAWGEAWARGPTLNYDVSPQETKDAAALTDKAASLAGSESPKNKALIAALKLRYATPDAAAAVAFAKAMDGVSRQHPEDDEIAIMTSDAWLQLWSNHQDSQGVPRSVSVLEPVLQRHPNSTGAIHFYIHATEIQGAPALALPYAERLGSLAPAASHLVHMASHTYFRVGRYEDAAVSNAEAIAVDATYARATHDPSVQGRIMYHGHDLRFGLAGALASGDAPLAVRFADHARYAYPAPINGAGPQMVIEQAYAALGRYAPDKALALTGLGKDAPFAEAMRHYARGEAFATKGDSAGVKAEAALVQVADGQMLAPSPDQRDAMLAVTKVARLTLEGRAAMLTEDYQAAVAAYEAAADVQDAKLANGQLGDPPPWWFPERRSVAAALLASGQPQRAVEEAHKALRTWPMEPLTLRVLAQAEQAEGKRADARRDAVSARRAWRGGAVSPAQI
jgi:tetratricopeptide (TPR) repeat protein